MSENPHKVGTPEWQAWLNQQVAAHDAENTERDALIDAELRAKAAEAAKKQTDGT